MSYFGPAWEIRTSKANAQKYLDGKPLPAMGHFTTIKQKRDNFGFMCHLNILNISGIYYVACSNVERKAWPAFFEFSLTSEKGANK